jgi:hypothetical protein
MQRGVKRRNSHEKNFNDKIKPKKDT